MALGREVELVPLEEALVAREVLVVHVDDVREVRAVRGGLFTKT